MQWRWRCRAGLDPELPNRVTLSSAGGCLVWVFRGLEPLNGQEISYT